ncbi:hypothetical protein D3C81_1641530 [compost metagenome]
MSSPNSRLTPIAAPDTNRARGRNGKKIRRTPAEHPLAAVRALKNQAALACDIDRR